jgi:hypothetical protein
MSRIFRTSVFQSSIVNELSLRAKRSDLLHLQGVEIVSSSRKAGLLAMTCQLPSVIEVINGSA